MKVDCGLKIACEMKLLEMVADCELQNPRSEIRDPKSECGRTQRKAKGRRHRVAEVMDKV